jgi:3'-phosphoadenosine 5'-phosphosulfate sulfotransferase (PAPS reductase)/FAD synthetase
VAPLQDWRTEHIWAYLDRHGIETPWIYSTPFGAIEGNAPFYTLRASALGGDVERCWRLVESLDARYSRAALGLT